MLKPFLLAAVIFLSAFSICAQPYAEVGKPCPDYLIHKIAYYSKKEATIKDFKGKWLLLDFWEESCGACIAAFPEKNRMQKELGDRVQVMLVNIRGEKSKWIYDSYRDKEGLTMPCAFDTNLLRQTDLPHAMPVTILIDDSGIVRCISGNINLDGMKAFLNGTAPQYPRVYRQHGEQPTTDIYDGFFHFDERKPFAINRNGGEDSVFMYRSILAHWERNGPPESHNRIISAGLEEHPGSFWYVGCTLEQLYYLAYFGGCDATMIFPAAYGEYARHLVLEIKDSSLFNYSFKARKNMFCYAVNFPGKNVSAEEVQRVLQQELALNFGFKVSKEIRKMPCWSIVATENARERVKTKSGEPTFTGNAMIGFKATNIPFINVVDFIRAANDVQGYIFDNTDIQGNVDIDMECKGCLMSDLMDIKKMLQKNGLDLIRTEKEVKVLVIKDPN